MSIKSDKWIQKMSIESDMISKFTDKQINRIFGPIGIKLGGKSAPEIALSIIAQLVTEVYKK